MNWFLKLATAVRTVATGPVTVPDRVTTNFRCIYDHDDILSVQAAKYEPETRFFAEASDGRFVSIYLSPEDTASLGAQLIDIAIKQGAITPAVLRDYSRALYTDAFLLHQERLAAGDE